jgi:hypothetical protein
MINITLIPPITKDVGIMLLPEHPSYQDHHGIELPPILLPDQLPTAKSPSLKNVVPLRFQD